MTISAIKRLNSKLAVDALTDMNKSVSDVESLQKGRLEARWEIENGKLVCKWIVI
ncbi:MAG: hypothetical protein SFY66_15930 [Oculatellaceae cyanobacterium bins.114]|nr:hypothetical protein [Oculatellaceae cyanobacterium bins.114]